MEETEVGRPRIWHVTLTLSGLPVESQMMRRALQRLASERPFFEDVRYTDRGVELRFFDQAESMIDVASLALRLWNEHRDSAALPAREVIGLEVVEKSLLHGRGESSRSMSTAPEVLDLSV